MTVNFMVQSLVLSALRAMAGALGLAAGLACANAEVTNDPGKATVFLRFVCTERVNQAPPGFDNALFTPDKRVGWGSGAFVRDNGLLVTTDHSL
jgi:hypothetical protein